MSEETKQLLKPTPIHPAFSVHMLNDQGKAKATELAQAFTELAAIIERNPPSRERSVAITKLEEASFFAKKAMAIQPENQQQIEAPVPKQVVGEGRYA